MNLLVSIYSALDPSHCYGKEGDKVTVISIHEKVGIVAGEDSNRFSVQLKDLSEQFVPVEETKPVVEAVIKPIVVFDQPIKPKAAAKQSKQKQPSLF